MGRVSTVLNRAADEIEKRGKARTTLINNRGNVCALGAIRIAAGGVVIDSYGIPVLVTARMNWDIYSESYHALDGYLLENKFYGNANSRDNGVAGWNDRNNKETVVKVMRDAAKHADYVDALKIVGANSKDNAHG